MLRSYPMDIAKQGGAHAWPYHFIWGLQDEPAEVLQSIAGITLAIVVDKKKSVPDALLQTAALLHDFALLVSPILRF